MHPALWALDAKHLDKRTDGFSSYNEYLDEDCQLINGVVASNLKARVATYTGKPVRVRGQARWSVWHGEEALAEWRRGG